MRAFTTAAAIVSAAMLLIGGGFGFLPAVWQNGGAPLGAPPTKINCSTNMSCSQSGDTVTVTATSGGGGAPTDATYITQTANASLSAEQALGSLATGILKNTTTTGVLSIAASGTDYAPATSGSAILKGNGSGGFSSAVSGTDYAPATSGSAVLLGNGSGAFSNYAGTSCTNQFPRSLSTAGAATCASVALGSDVSGTLPLANITDSGTASQCLLSGGAGGDPAWGACGSSSGTFPTGKLAADVTCAVSASYCTIWSITPAASQSVAIRAHILIVTGSTTVAPQFRVSSADTGYVGICTWTLYDKATATTTAPAYVNTAIAAAPADTASTAWPVTTITQVEVNCALQADASPGAILIEWQLETGTSPTQTVKAGSYYSMGAGP